MRKFAALCLLVFSIFGSAPAYAQSKISLKEALDQVTKEFGTKFVYERSVIAGKTTSVDISGQKGRPIEDVLKNILYPNNLLFLYVDFNHYTIVKNDEKSITPGEVSNNNPGTSPAVTYATASQRVVTGKVSSFDNKPLGGVSITAKQSGSGTTSDDNGFFSIDVKKNDILSFSFVGYITQEIAISDETNNINVILQAQQKKLDEVVVIAYGTTTKKDLTGSVSQITGKSIAELPPTINVEQALQGRAAGVLVTQESGQPGAATRVRIRGSSSLLGSNQPLYVVDGIPVVAESNIPDDGSAFNNGLIQQGLNSPLGNINIDDIESISVLKDASATAIYGSRAANGVVIITTKKGRGKPTYTLSSSLSYQKAETDKVLNADQFREVWTEAVNNSTSTSAFAQAIRNGTYFGNANTNWEKEITPANPLTRNLNFSVSGGNDKIKYHTGAGVANQSGSFESAFFKRYNFLVNLNMNVSRKLNIGTSVNLSSSQQGSPDGSLLTRIYTFRPDLPVFDEDGKYTYSPFSAFENPVALSHVRNTNKTNMLLGSVFAEFKILKELVLKSSLAVNYNNGKFTSFYPRYTTTGGYSIANGPGLGFAQESTSETVSTLLEHTLTYNKIISPKHTIGGVLGAAWQGDNNEYIKASGKGFPQDDVLINLSSASQDYIIGSNKIQSGLISYFGRLNYQYDKKYLLTLSARTDGSSKFAKENKWAFFPTAALGWRISDEKLFKNVKFLDELKLRASIGLTGQQNFGAYQWLTLFEATNYGGSPGVNQNQLGNDKLKWELTKQTDIGLDFSLFNSQLNGTIDWYQKNTSDLLYFFKTPGNTGYSTVIGNLGNTQNKGLEFSLDGDIIRNNNFSWNLAFNIAFNRNKLVKLNDDYLESSGFINPPNTGSLLKIGEPIGLIYGYISEGIFQTQAEIDALNAAAGGFYQVAATSPGDLKFKDINGDGKVTTLDQAIIGNALPKYSGGFTNSFEYKGLRLSSLFTYVVGNDLRWGTESSNINFGSQAQENKLATVLNRWTPTNPTNQPRAVFLDPNNNRRISSYYVHKGTYLRLKNLYLSYDFPAKLLKKAAFLKTVSVYASGTNLFTFTKYPGANPETSNLYNDDVSSGLDNSRYPISKVYTFGLKVIF